MPLIVSKNPGTSACKFFYWPLLLLNIVNENIYSCITCIIDAKDFGDWTDIGGLFDCGEKSSRLEFGATKANFDGFAPRSSFIIGSVLGEELNGGLGKSVDDLSGWSDEPTAEEI